jgi:tetratricopeptide (TPR) repeat protein
LADPGHEALVIEVARRHLREKKPKAALEVLAPAARAPDASALLYATLAVAYAETGQSAAAVTAYRTAIKRAPQQVFAYRSLALLHLYLKQPKEALQVIESASRQPVSDLPFALGVAESYANYLKQQPKDAPKVKPLAVGAVNRARKLAGDDPQVLPQVAELYEAVNEPAQAEQIYLDLVKRFPLASVLRGKLTGLYLRGGKKDRATEQLEALAKENPANPNVHYLLGSVAAEEKKYDKAAESFERAVLLNPDFEDAYYDLAGMRLALDQPREALKTMGKARMQFSKKFLIEFYSGIANARLKDFGEAIKNLTTAESLAKAGETNRLTPQFYFQLGSMYERKGDLEPAEKYLRKAIELSPKFAEALNYLGYMWADKGIKLAEARKMIEQALELEPKNAAYLDSLAWVLYRLDLPREALGHQLKAIELSEQPDATLQEHLGDIHAALKDFPKAREAWKKSLEIEPNESIRKKLEALPGGQGGT